MKKIKEKELIYGGSDQGIILDMVVKNSKNIRFIDIIENNPFQNLKEKISTENFNFIKADLHILHGTETKRFREAKNLGLIEKVGIESFNYYKIESDNLSLYYYKVDNYIYIYGFGETQPCLYKLYLEGVYEL
ncbi:hypothetical protein ETU10_06925 [Apibacter muscae]|uniref:hypothetical protein n=1 Tax=Apibacter muscae TaxID=2509004 RepID=UPI0011ACF192|nr:hypothetical protein [Apibacter muscae]TWP23456.1 hypothetical protein ETU10_06925 [Apibacter muscae]